MRQKCTGNQKQNQQKKEFDCKRCHTRHVWKKCPAYGTKCDKCGKYNHVAKACIVNVHYVEGQEPAGSSEEEHGLFIGLVGTEKMSEVTISQYCQWIHSLDVDSDIISAGYRSRS